MSDGEVNTGSEDTVYRSWLEKFGRVGGVSTPNEAIASTTDYMTDADSSRMLTLSNLSDDEIQSVEAMFVIADRLDVPVLRAVASRRIALKCSKKGFRSKQLAPMFKGNVLLSGGGALDGLNRRLRSFAEGE